jgi:hypothetical protein
MRAITLSACLLAAGLFAATFAGSSASADWSSNYAWCLMTLNLTDAVYAAWSDTTYPDQILLGAPRTYEIGASARW